MYQDQILASCAYASKATERAANLFYVAHQRIVNLFKLEIRAVNSYAWTIHLETAMKKHQNLAYDYYLDGKILANSFVA
jgi:hypothetical protein